MEKKDIHYIKSSIYKWNGDAHRFKVNMSIVGANNQKMHQLKWLMTPERREWKNSVPEEEQSWYGWAEAIDRWKQIRHRHGHDVKLWIGKLHQRSKWSKGKPNSDPRVENAVSIICLSKTTGYLRQTVWWDDDICLDYWFQTQSGPYNMMWDYRNPLSTIQGTTKTVRIEL